MRSRQLDRTFSRLTTEIPAFIRVFGVSEDGEACLYLNIIQWVTAQTDASSSWRTFIWSTDQCQAWEMMCWRCVLLFEADVSLFMSADECWMLPGRATRRVISCGWGLTAGAPRSHRSFSRREWQKEPLPSCPNVPRWRVRTCENT